MSELQLSDELMTSLHKVVSDYDERAKDPNFLVQYLAASLGYILGSTEMPLEDKNNFLDQLIGFSKEIVNDVHGKQSNEGQISEAVSNEDTNAAGVPIWKP